MSIWHVVGKSAAIQIFVAGLSGVLGIITSRVIISNFGVQVYGQYGLLTTLPALMPFADLGIAVIIVNNIAGSPDPRRDETVRRTITSAFRLLVVSGLTIASIGVVIQLAGLWPVVLGGALLAGGDLVATLCMIIFGAALPLSVGARILVGLSRNPIQAAIQGLNAPIILALVLSLATFGVPGGNATAITTYVASASCSMVGLAVATHLLKPQVGKALRDVPRLREVRGVRVINTAWPMLVQMISLPIAMQTGRILLSHLGTSTELAEYNLASQLFGIALQAIATAGVALWPHFAKARGKSEARSPFLATVVFSAGGLGLGLGVCLILPLIVSIVAQGRIHLDAAIVIAFLAFVTVQAAKYPSGMYMTDERGLRFQVLPVMLMIPINLGLIWWLIPVFGAAGPVVATTISVLICQVIPNALWVRRDLERRRLEGALAAGSATVEEV